MGALVEGKEDLLELSEGGVELDAFPEVYELDEGLFGFVYGFIPMGHLLLEPVYLEFPAVYFGLDDVLVVNELEHVLLHSLPFHFEFLHLHYLFFIRLRVSNQVLLLDVLAQGHALPLFLLLGLELFREFGLPYHVLRVLAPLPSVQRQLRDHHALEAVLFLELEVQAQDLVGEAAGDAPEVGVEEVGGDQAQRLVALEEHLEERVRPQGKGEVGDQVVVELGHETLNQHWLQYAASDV